MLLHENDLVLFQGDSITDAGRRRVEPEHLGNGYAMIAAGRCQVLHPRLKLRFLNRGISGNRAKDLRARWQEDCLDLRPTVVSILIGINDTWRRYDKNDPTAVDAFTADLRDLLDDCAEAGMRIVLCEPFVLPVPEDRKKWREDLDPRIQALRSLAAEYAAAYVPYDGLFAAAAVASGNAAHWAADGVHPSPAGHALMADAWLRAVGAAV